MNNETALELLSDSFVNAFDVVLVEVDATMLLHFEVNLRRVVRHIWQKIEPRQVRNVVKGNLFDSHSETRFAAQLAKWTS